MTAEPSRHLRLSEYMRANKMERNTTDDVSCTKILNENDGIKNVLKTVMQRQRNGDKYETERNIDAGNSQKRYGIS